MCVCVCVCVCVRVRVRACHCHVTVSCSPRTGCATSCPLRGAPASAFLKYFRPFPPPDAFDTERSISLVPPDGEFALLNYRTTHGLRPPFRLHVSVDPDPASDHKALVSLRLFADAPPDKVRRRGGRSSGGALRSVPVERPPAMLQRSRTLLPGLGSRFSPPLAAPSYPHQSRQRAGGGGAPAARVRRALALRHRRPLPQHPCHAPSPPSPKPQRPQRADGPGARCASLPLEPRLKSSNPDSPLPPQNRPPAGWRWRCPCRATSSACTATPTPASRRACSHGSLWRSSTCSSGASSGCRVRPLGGGVAWLDGAAGGRAWGGAKGVLRLHSKRCTQAGTRARTRARTHTHTHTCTRSHQAAWTAVSRRASRSSGPTARRCGQR